MACDLFGLTLNLSAIAQTRNCSKSFLIQVSIDDSLIEKKIIQVMYRLLINVVCMK